MGDFRLGMIESDPIAMTESLPSKWARRSSSVSPTALTSVMLGVIVVAVLYFAREVLVPIALAVLLSFVLSPLVRLLQRLYFPRGAAVLVVAVVAFSAIFALGALMVTQVNDLAKVLPGYQSTLQAKIQTLRGAAAGTGTLERASRVLKDLSKEIDQPNETEPAPSVLGSAPNKPIPVEVEQPDPGALQTLAVLITPLIQPLTTTGIVVIFVIFILFQQQDLRNRLVRLAGAQDLQRTTLALDDAGARLSRLFLTQLALNAGFGLIVGLGLYIIGVPSAPLWGMLSTVLRFVPYIGALISAIFPLVLAAAVGTGWAMVLWTAALFLVLEPIAGQVIEPLLYGRNSGLSPVAVIASAAFWTWLWGPIGLILATPLTICLVVLGHHVDRLKFLEVMFGDQPPLSPAELIYQRMLARDPVEVAEQAHSFLREKPLVAYFDEILLEGLKIAGVDAKKGLLDSERMQRIRDAVGEIIEDVATHEDKNGVIQLEDTEKVEDTPLSHLQNVEDKLEVTSFLSHWRTGTPVLCIPGVGLLDEAVAMMLARLLQRRGIGARAEKAGALSMSQISGWDTVGTELICLCYVEDATAAQTRYDLRRLRRKDSTIPVVVTLVGRSDEYETQKQPNEIILCSLRETIDHIVAVARDPKEDQGVESR